MIAISEKTKHVLWHFVLYMSFVISTVLSFLLSYKVNGIDDPTGAFIGCGIMWTVFIEILFALLYAFICDIFIKISGYIVKAKRIKIEKNIEEIVITHKRY